MQEGFVFDEGAGLSSQDQQYDPTSVINEVRGLDAAHIQWFTADGPDLESNGMAMCSLHHKIFDLGAFTVEPTHLSIVFSQNLQLGDATRAQLLSYHEAGIFGPQSTGYAPDRAYLNWHAKEVFKAPGRVQLYFSGSSSYELAKVNNLI